MNSRKNSEVRKNEWLEKKEKIWKFEQNNCRVTVRFADGCEVKLEKRILLSLMDVWECQQSVEIIDDE